jgi:hypothetical protein
MKVTEARGLDADALDRMHLVEAGGDCGLRLSDPKNVDVIRRVIDRVKGAAGLDVVTFDPFARFMTGNENSTEDMRKAVDPILELLAEFELVAVVPHHTSQTGTGLDASRGSTYFVDSVASIMNLTPVGEEADNTRRRLDVVRCRYSERLEDLGRRTLEFDPATEVYREAGYGRAVERLLDALPASGDWITQKDLQGLLNVGETAARNTRDKAKAAGVIEVREDGRRKQVRRVAGVVNTSPEGLSVT